MASLKHIISILERLAPPRLAESWDNTGIILHPEKLRANSPRILLTIDLTPAVCQEALDTPTSVIVAYHPPIFKPLSSLSYNDPIQNSLLKCAAAGIAVYCPHTALDTVQGGINDWLAHGLGNGGVESIRSIPGEDVGIGRRVSLANEVPLDALVAKIKNFLHINNVQIGVPTAFSSLDQIPVKTIALCAGAGGSVIGNTAADVYFTGEMPHHEVLAAVGRGTSVVLCGHTNTERGYLPTFRSKILEELGKEDVKGWEVYISNSDRHPLSFV